MRKVLVLVVGMTIVMNLSAYEVWTDVQTGIEWKYQLIGDEVAVGGGDGQCENTAVPKSQNGVLSVPFKINGKRVTAIGPYAFCDCKGLTSILIPDTVTRFEHHAFSGCSGLEAVTIPEGIMRIDWAAFGGCSGLLSVTIPSSVTGIEDGAFDGCYNISSYDVNKDNQNYKSENGILLTKDGRRLVAGVKGVNLVPDGVTVIGGSAYYGITTLTSITFPDSIEEIGWAAFSGCIGLKSVVLPEGVVRIGDFAFAGCSSMAYVSLPSSVVFIGDQAFSGCSAMQSFCVETTNPSFKSVDGLLLTKDGTVLLAGVNGSVMVPDGVKSIGACAFDGCSGLESVAIPIGVTSIGDNAFRDCSGLQSIAIPDGMKSIGRAALSGCTGLTTLSLPSSVTNIGVAAFDWCCNLTSMVVPGSVSCVEGWAFDYCQGLESVTIAEGVGSIGMCAFQCCENLISIIVPSSVTTIGYGAFNACTMLCDMTFEGTPPEGLLKALINQDVLIRYNVAFKNEWLPVIAECGFTNAVPYSPLPKGAVVFIAPNGEVSVETHVYTNETYGVLPEARRDGFTFAGWYTSLAGNERVSAFSAVDPAVKALYAHWANDIKTSAVLTNTVVNTLYETNTVVKMLYETNTIEKTEAVFVTNIVEQVHEVEVEKIVTVEQVETVFATNYIDVVVTNYVGVGDGDIGKVSDEVMAFMPDVGFDGSQKRTLNGIAFDGDGVFCGLAQITTAKATRSDVKVGGFVMLADGKKLSLKSTTGLLDSGIVSARTKVGKIGDIDLVIGANGFRGQVGGLTVVSANPDDESGVVKGSMTLSYFDPKTLKLKTKRISLAGIAVEGEATGNIEVKGSAIKGFAAEIE